MFELGDLDRAPSLGGADERTEHQFQDRAFAECIGDDLEPTALLDKKSFKQIRRADGTAMRHREAQMGDTGFEVVHEAGDRAVVFTAIVGDDAGREIARYRPARRLIGRLRAYLELRPNVFWHLGRQVCACDAPDSAAERRVESKPQSP
jgi:hypothetical protein